MTNKLMLWGRVLMSLIFLAGAYGKITGFAGAVAYATAYGVPIANVAVVIATIIELCGGLGLLLGHKARLTAWILTGYVIILTLVFHTALSDPMQQAHFMKNLAIIGGLLYVIAHGAGTKSLDKR